MVGSTSRRCLEIFTSFTFCPRFSCAFCDVCSGKGVPTYIIHIYTLIRVCGHPTPQVHFKFGALLVRGASFHGLSPQREALPLASVCTACQPHSRTPRP